MIFLKRNVIFLLACVCTSSAFSDTQTPDETSYLSSSGYVTEHEPRHHRWVATLLGGYANLRASGHSQSFTGSDDDKFTYTNQGKRENTGFIGGFVGFEKFRHPKYIMQAGFQYNYFGTVKIKGTNSVGIEPATSTIYHYRYHFEAQQLLLAGKLLTTTHKIYHPYLFAGIGLSLNRANQYFATPTETGCANLTPGFNSQTQHSFSYALGIGVDTDINQTIRIGLGYMFADLGRFALGNGQVKFNQYISPVAFAPGSSHVYTNTLLMQITYKGNKS